MFSRHLKLPKLLKLFFMVLPNVVKAGFTELPIVSVADLKPVAVFWYLFRKKKKKEMTLLIHALKIIVRYVRCY